ncbi:MAG: 23S rRNA (guanosine(2251)-2'-O)-methyltransferase RlmB [Austwickia sp.]|jgi:23S rRNA (guanosine2251-2'-O)-methyltransferase|nr:23S rRNA (guanosine(2251)-2'-O)-methyltransferase RlmB [Austwickia sp.]MBK9102036.1 23S rRNA (guanosine(2251)-2'-O)-methyltransferase RlmB [Austwickia sp.]
MAGNTRRPGATRRPTSKKGPVVGTGGHRRRGLEGKGPTPKAEDRVNHKAHKVRARKESAGSEGGVPRRTAALGRSGTRATSGGREIVVGRNSVVEALRAGIPVSTMYVAGRVEVDDRVREALTHATSRSIPVLETPRGELDRLTDGANHQGLAIMVPPYRYLDPEDLIDPEQPGVPLIVALDGVTDPRNLGAVLRCVSAFGGHGVVVPTRRSVGVNAGAWKASAGAAARVPVAQATNLTRALERYRSAGFFVVGLAADGSVSLPDLQLTDVPLVLVIGSEGKGLSRLVQETCDQVVSIPMGGGLESLNAGVAAGIALYEVARLRGIFTR